VTTATARRSPPGGGEAVPRVAGRTQTLILAAAGILVLGFVAAGSGMHHQSAGNLADSTQAAARALAASLLLFGVCGFGVTRLFLPEGLRRHELLWVLPAGACTSALALTVLGFAYVPFRLALALTIAGGAALAAVALRRRPGSASLGRGVGWPAIVAVVACGVALAPYFAIGFPTVIGDGSDSHLAVGMADFLQDNHPTAENPDEPLDEVFILWRSKQPIYYALGAVSSLSGLEPFEVIAPLSALLLALAAAGMYLVARELLGAGVVVACAAMAVTALDRMVLHTGMHPYFNQTWGYFTLPFSLVLGWWAVRRRSGPALGLLLLFLAIGAFAYPLALPIPVLAVAVFWGLELRERRRRGEPAEPLVRRLWRGPRSLVWIVPLALVLAVPLMGVAEKLWAGLQLVFEGSLKSWGGDLFYFVPGNQFFALPFETLWWLVVAGMGVLAAWALARAPRPLGVGIGAALVVFLGAAVWFRQREFGQYVEFKALAFAAPLFLVCAAVGMGRLRRAGPVLLGLLVVSAAVSGRQEQKVTGTPVPETIVDVREWDRDLPESASVRFDTTPDLQIWLGYFMPGQPVCSLYPLLNTSYPRVEYSRSADYLLVERKLKRRLPDRYRGRWPDTAGAPLRSNAQFELYRAKRGLPGRDRCSRRLVKMVENL
jgi:hypothetical protein